MQNETLFLALEFSDKSCFDINFLNLETVNKLQNDIEEMISI